MKAWGMAIISSSRRTITACPLLISFGNAVHFSTKCSLFFGTYNGPFISNGWNVPCQEGGFQIHLIRSLLRSSLKEKSLPLLLPNSSVFLTSHLLRPSLSLPIIPLCPLPTLPVSLPGPFISISANATYQLAVSRETVITCAHVFCIQLPQPL